MSIINLPNYFISSKRFAKAFRGSPESSRSAFVGTKFVLRQIFGEINWNFRQMSRNLAMLFARISFASVEFSRIPFPSSSNIHLAIQFPALRIDCALFCRRRWWVNLTITLRPRSSVRTIDEDCLVSYGGNAISRDLDLDASAQFHIATTEFVGRMRSKFIWLQIYWFRSHRAI